MELPVILDVVIFFAFVIAVIAVGIGKSRHEKDSEDYFLAGRDLTWWLIGFSLIAANISSEHFVGMSGQAARYVGLAIASYEWMAAITLVVVAFFFLPKFLRAGIYTIPEFLEYRFNHASRTLMSLLVMVIYILVTIPAVIYSGGLTIVVLFRDISLWGDFQVTLANASWVIGLLAAVYVVAGGLKACAWADLIQGSALILGGAIVTFLAFQALGAADPQSIGLGAEHAASSAIERFRELNSEKLHMALPATDLILPWTALLVGLWIPNFYYWGLNQYICQRTLGAQSLADGQKGVVFAAGLKLLIPFVIVIPGIVAVNLYAPELRQEAALENQAALDRFSAAQGAPATTRQAFDFDTDFAALNPDAARQMLEFNRAVAGTAPKAEDESTDLATQNVAVLAEIKDLNRDRPEAERIVVQPQVAGYRYDSAFPLLMKHLVRPGVRGFVLAALLGAVISSLASMLNASSTIFTMDLYGEYLNTNASQANLVAFGRLCVVIFAAVGCLVAPLLGDPRFKGIFTYIQEFQGFLSPGVLAVFIFGLFLHRAPRICGVIGLVLSPITYGLLYFFTPDIAFLNRMAITFGVEIVVLGALTLLTPLQQPVTLPEQTKIALVSSSSAKIGGALVVVATLALYWLFW
jgi:SSS family solute:Na+ symporter